MKAHFAAQFAFFCSFSTQNLCICVCPRKALWASHSFLSPCPHHETCSCTGINCYPCWQSQQKSQAWGPFCDSLSLPHLMFFESKCTHGCFPCSTWTVGTGFGLSLALLVLFKNKIQKKSFKGKEYLGEKELLAATRSTCDLLRFLSCCICPSPYSSQLWESSFTSS